ncbi:MAG: hypothetical protein H0W18_09525, partial [Acidobacteria bacterium]|nr:hypothetical protein [Acidobacteriota bacterium]
MRDPLTEALRARTRWVIVVPAIAVINVVLFVCMTVDSTGGSHSEAMLA